MSQQEISTKEKEQMQKLMKVTLYESALFGDYTISPDGKTLASEGIFYKTGALAINISDEYPDNKKIFEKGKADAEKLKEIYISAMEELGIK